MNSPIEPLADNVIIQQEEAKTRTASGIYIPDSAKETPKVATVVAVGDEVKRVKAGDQIIYKDNYDDDKFQFGGKEYIVVKEKNIHSKLKQGSKK